MEVISLIVILLFIALLGSVSGANAGGSVPSTIRQRGSIQIELSVNKVNYAVGEPVDVTLSITNEGGEAVGFQFATGQMYDFVVLQGGQRIWQWSHGRVFTQALTTLVIRARESKVFQERWDQRDTQNRQVPSAEYEISAVFPAQSGRVPSPPEGPFVRFWIGGEMQAHRPVVSSRPVSVAGSTLGEVLLDGRPVLRIRVAAGGLSALERGTIVAARLRRFLDAGLKPEQLTVARVGTEAAIMWRSRLVVTADASHARLNHTSAYALALQWRQSLVHGLSIRP
jgi:hypothetical protein